MKHKPAFVRTNAFWRENTEGVVCFRGKSDVRMMDRVPLIKRGKNDHLQDRVSGDVVTGEWAVEPSWDGSSVKGRTTVETEVTYVWWLNMFCILSGKLLGMNETSATITMATANTSSQAIAKQVLSVANVGVVSLSQNNVHRWIYLRLLTRDIQPEWLSSPSSRDRHCGDDSCFHGRCTLTDRW